MADSKISALTAATTLADTDKIVIASGGTTKSLTGALLKASIAGDSHEILLAADGLLGANFTRFMIDTVQSVATGTVRYSALPLAAGSVVTKLWYLVSVNATGVTTIKAGLSDKNGNNLASSANVTTAFDADDSYASITLSSPYTVVADTVVFATVLFVGSGAPSLGALAGVAGKGVAIGSGTPLAGFESSQTDLDATATVTVSTVPLWVGWS